MVSIPEWWENIDFEDLMVDCLNILTQHSNGENKEKYGKPQSGFLITQLYCQGVKVTTHISIVSVRLYNVRIASNVHILLSGMMFRNGSCLTSTFGNKLQFILHMNKEIHHFHLAIQSQFQCILRTWSLYAE